MSVTLRRYQMNNLKFSKTGSNGPVIVLLGRRDTGKTVLTKDILSHNPDLPVVTVISGTEAGNGFYSRIVPRIFIHNEYKIAIVDAVLSRQKGVIKQIREEEAKYGKCTIDGRTILIMDDCLYDPRWTRDVCMRTLFMNGRHWKVMLIITMQYPMGIPPVLRTNIDYTFILRDNNISNRRKIYDNYAGCVPTFESFCQIMDQCTEEFGCVVIDNNVKSNKLADQVFWYKANPNIRDFRIGAKQFWDMSENMEDEEPEIEPGKRKRKGEPAFKVRKKW